MLLLTDTTGEIDTLHAARSYVQSGRPARILFLSHRFPYPPIGGDRVKAYHLLRHLSGHAEVDVISLDEARSVTQHTPGLEEVRSMISVPFNRATAALRIVGSLLTQRPIEFAYYHAPEMQRAVDEALAKSSYDLIICFFLRTAEYVTEHTKTPKLLIAEDARVILQERASLNFELSPQYLVRKIDAYKLKQFEPRVMAKGFDLVTFVSREDESRIRESDKGIPTSILSNGVDLDEFEYSVAPREAEVVFAGHLGVYHNVLMARRLTERIFPLIKRLMPEAKLAIVGKDPDAKLRSVIARTPGASLYANVPNVRLYLERARAFVHPQEVGAGIQNKLLEAMAVGTPVVTSTIGASGIEGVVDEENALIRRTDAEFAEAAIALLRDESQARGLAINARRLMEDRYSWEHVFERLDQIVEQLIGERKDK